MAWVETLDGAVNLERVDSLIVTKGIMPGDEHQRVVRVTAMQNGERRHVIDFKAELEEIADKNELCKDIIQYLASLATSTLYIKHTDIAKNLEGHK